MPLPTIAGQQVQWVCEFCYAMSLDATLPATWDFLWQAAVCPECRERVARDGGYGVVIGGAYAAGEDPRGEGQRR